MDNYATHQKVLFKAVTLTPKSVIEFGAGDHSTAQLHDLCRDRLLVTIEDNAEWRDKFIHLGDYHHLILSDTDEIPAEDWGVVFVDNGTWEARLEMIERYRNATDFMIIHDSEAMHDWSIVGPAYAEKFENIMDWSVYFRYFAEFQDTEGPCTLLGSNTTDVSGLEIEGMKRIYR